MRSPLADRFADFEGIAYLDVANQGPLPIAAARAAEAAIADKEHPYRIANDAYFTLTRTVRELYARLLGANAEQVAITTGAGAGVNAVARGLELGEGDEVVLPAAEFPSNHYPWLHLLRRGVRVVEVEPDHPSGSVSPAALCAHIGPHTRVVAFAHVSYLHGGRIDPTPVVEAARRVGALTVVDGSQAAGAMPFHFATSGVDCYVVSGYKFLLGPYGTGVALFSGALLERLQVGDINWWAVEGAEDFNHLPDSDFRLCAGARRWDAHEPASFINLAAMAESLRFGIAAGVDMVAAHARAIGAQILAGLPRGFRLASPPAEGQRSHILCVAAASPQATAAAHARLATARVRVSLRGDRLRIAPHLYNDEHDVARVLAALA